MHNYAHLLEFHPRVSWKISPSIQQSVVANPSYFIRQLSMNRRWHPDRRWCSASANNDKYRDNNSWTRKFQILLNVNDGWWSNSEQCWLVRLWRHTGDFITNSIVTYVEPTHLYLIPSPKLSIYIIFILNWSSISVIYSGIF